MELLHLVVRQWRQRKGRTALSILSVAIAVAAVLGTALSQSSVRSGVRSITRAVGGRPALEIVSAAGGRLSPSELPEIDDIPGVEASFPLVTRATLARTQGKRFRGVLLGLPADDPEAWQALPLASGRHCEESNEAVMSAELADSLNVEEGDRITLLSRRGPRSVTVVGLVKGAVLAEFAPAVTLVLPLSAVQQFFSLGDLVDRERVFVDNEDVRDKVRDAIAKRLSDAAVVQEPVGKIAQVDSTLKSTEMALRFAGSLSMAMAVFIILNTLRMNFGERRREVAVLRVLGSTSKQIVVFHLAEGILMGLVGSVVGIPLGILIGRGLTHGMQGLLHTEIPHPPIQISAILIALVIGPVVAAIASIAPAWQSRRVSPREAMGDEELRRAERFPKLAVILGAVLSAASVFVMLLVVSERLPPTLAIPAGLLMLVAFVAIIPAVLPPVVKTIGWLLSPAFQMEGELAADQLRQRSTRAGLTVGVLVVAIANGLGLGTAIENNVNDIREWYRRSLAGDVFLLDPTAADRAAAAQDHENVHDAVTNLSDVAYVVEVRILPIRADGMPGICIVRDFLPDVELPWSVTSSEEKDIRAGLAEGEIVVSGIMARQLHVSVGDNLRLELQGRATTVRVAGLVSDYMVGGMVTYLDQHAAAKLVELGPAETYMVRAKPDVSTEQLTESLKPLAAAEGLSVQSLADLRGRLDRLINGVVAALWGLLAVGFVVGGIAVANTLTMSVLEQTRELGLMRIAGMTRHQVRKMVLCESLLLGLLGALCGMLTGTGTAFIIHLCNEPVLGRAIPFTLHFWLYALNGIGCVLIVLLAAWSPGERAARLNLLESIAYE